ncbi:MAG: caspase family protein [Bacteroidota bacterium]
MINKLHHLLCFLIIFLMVNCSVGQKLQMIVPKGHTSNIKMAIYNPKYPLIATASNDKTIKLWDEKSGKLIYTFTGHKSGVNSIIFSPNGKMLAASSDSLVYLWDVINEQLIFKKSCSVKPVKTLFFSPNSQFLIYQVSQSRFSVTPINNILPTIEFSIPDTSYSATLLNTQTNILYVANNKGAIYQVSPLQDTIVKLYAQTNQSISHLGLQNHILFAVTNQGNILSWDIDSKLQKTVKLGFRPTNICSNFNGKIIALSDTLNNIHIFDLAKNRTIQIIPSNLAKIESLTLGNTDTIIAASCIEIIKVWKITGELIRENSKHTKDVEKIQFNSDDSKFLSCGYDEYALEWNYSKNPINNLSGYTQNINNIVYSSNNQHFATVSGNDSVVKIWSNKTGRVVSVFKGNQNGVDYLNVAPLHNYLLASGNNYNAQLWNFTTGDSITSLVGHKWKITDSEFSVDEKYVLTASLDETIKLWSIPEGKLIKSFESKKWLTECASFNPNFNFVVTSSSDSKVCIWRTRDGKMLKKLKTPKLHLTDIQFISNSDTLVALSKTGQIYIIDARRNAIIDTLNRKNDLFTAMSVSEDKKWIFASENGSVIIWDVDNWRIKSILPGFKGYFTTIQVNSDGTKMMTNSRNSHSSSDNIFTLWDINSSSVIATFSSHAMPIRTARFSPDNKFIITTSTDHTLKLWSAETGKELLTMLTISQNNWLITTPEGLFDASPSTMRLIHFVVNTPTDSLQPWKIIELEQLKHRYYQPSLWNIVTGNSTEQLRSVPSIDSIEPPPTFSIFTVADSIIVEYSSDTAQIGKTSLFVDDIEIVEDIRNSGILSNKSRRIAIDLTPFANLLNIDSANTFKAIAYNREGYLSSKPQTCSYSYQLNEKGYGTKKKANQHAKKVTLYAIVVGTSDYAGDNIDLKYAAKDAAEFAHALEISSSCLFGVGQTKVILFTTDGNQSLNTPIKDSIQKQIDWVAKKARPEDIIVVYFSGHGVNYGGQDGDFYYITKEASAATQSYLNDPFIRKKYAISSTELTLWMNKISARKKVLIIDACASGKAAELMLANVKEVPSSQIRAFERMKDRTGFYILAGSASDAVSYETSIYGQGLLTYSLLKAIKGAYLRRDGAEEYVDIAMLLQYAVDEVPRLAKGIGGIQQPLYRSPSEQRSFDIGCMNNETKNQICIAEPKPIFCATTFIDEKLKRDGLKLSELINNQMRENPIKSKVSPYLYTDGIGYPNAYIISGTYATIDQGIKVDFVISQNDQMIGSPISLSAQKSELKMLVNAIIQQAIIIIQKSEYQPK